MITLHDEEGYEQHYNPALIVKVCDWWGAQNEMRGMAVVYANGDYERVRETVDEVLALIASSLDA